MSLQGSLDSFALPDVLVLLSSTKKNGELRVTGDRVEGRVWLEKGQVVHTEISGQKASAVDAVFELLRLEKGDFSFHAGETPSRQSHPVTIDSVLADAQLRLGEWSEIARVVPHLDAVVDMAPEAPADEVRVSRNEWNLLRLVAGGRSVSELMAALSRSEFDTCKTVKQLVDSKLATVDARAGSRPARQTAADPAPSAAARPDPAAQTPPRPAAPPVRQPAGDESRDPAKVGAAAAAAVGNELDALAELASRPRKLRSNTSASGSDAGDRPAQRPAERPADRSAGRSGYGQAPAEEPKSAEEAKALVAQLAALGGDDEEKVAQKVAEHLASGGELPEVPDGDEPINRGLLLKFLSSVRN